jgi:3-hydroxyisobutyrate dehydrogenase
MKTAVLGLGAMGGNMARNLAKLGHLATVWNRTQSKAAVLAEELNVSVAPNPAAAAEAADLVITCVSRDADVEAVVESAAPGLAAGKIIVDTSTISAKTTKILAGRLAANGVSFLDSPVSGGVEGARLGTLVMMVGGDEMALERARDTLGAIAKQIAYMGPSGSGQITKAVNQIMCAGINQAVTEALAFGVAQGIDIERAIDVVRGGAAGNWFLDHRGKTMVKFDFATGFKVALHLKDLAIAQAMAQANPAAAIPIIEMTIHHYEELMAAGYGDEDISALYRIKSGKL